MSVETIYALTKVKLPLEPFSHISVTDFDFFAFHWAILAGNMAKLIISTSPVSTLPTPSDLINDLCATQIIHYPEVAKFSRCSIRRLNQECVLSLHRAGGFSHITPGQFTTSAQREVTIFNPLSKEIIATTRAFPY